MTVISPKKLIEVALPLDAINTECTRRKRKAPAGYPTSFHKWWAQRPVAAVRAVIFAQLVHDPEDLWRCQHPGAEPNQQVKGHWTKARARLFSIIEDLVKWENTTNESVLEKARAEIRKAWQETCELNKNDPQAKELFNLEKMPGMYDPFAGGGTIPLEAQRLGLVVHASDLNPVAVVINKAMIEIPPKFAGRPPVHPDARNALAVWTGAAGPAEDVLRYGKWMRDEAFKQIGHLYPPVEISEAMAKDRPDLKLYVGEKVRVIAWLWVRTVSSPSPAYSHLQVPLASSFVLSNNLAHESYVQPIVDEGNYHFRVRVGKPPIEARMGTKAARGSFRCLMSGTPISGEYLQREAKAGRMGRKLMAIVGEQARGRIFLSPTAEHERIANSVIPTWKPNVEFFKQALGFRIGNYGMAKWSDLFTDRQSVALTVFSDLVSKVLTKIREDAFLAGMPDDDRTLAAGGVGARAYAEAVSVYLWCILARVLHYSNTNCTWLPKDSAIARTFTKQAIPMVWDYAEGSLFEKCSTNWDQCLNVVTSCMLNFPGFSKATAFQGDAANCDIDQRIYISTDPPYYDNVGYADLSDFFYVWMRRTLREIYPGLFSTIVVPKMEELVATPHRHGTKQQAEKFFLDGMTQAMRKLAEKAHPAAPITIYYAFKQNDTESEGTNSIGWETFLEAVNRAGLALTGTWPMRTEGDNRQRGLDANALASSIILVCRPRAKDVGTISRRQFVRMLNEALPLALDAMTRESEGMHSPVAPVTYHKRSSAQAWRSSVGITPC